MAGRNIRESKVSARRRERRGLRRITAPAACAVVLLTAIAFMAPAISMTADSAQHKAGAALNAQEIEMAVQAVDSADGEASGADADASGESGRSAKGQAADEQAGGDSADNGSQDAPPAGSDGQGQGDEPAAADDTGADAPDVPADGDGIGGSDGDDPDAVDAGDYPAEGDVPEGDDMGADAVDPDAAESGDAADPDADSAALAFAGELKDGNGKVTLAVEVEAPAGALPKGTTMQLAPVKGDDVADAVDGALADAADRVAGGAADHDAEFVAAAKANAKVKSIQAVDISFVDADGNEVEPAEPITVRLASKQIKKHVEGEGAKSAESVAADAGVPEDVAARPMVVHIANDGTADVVDVLAGEQLEQRDLPTAAKDEIVFDSGAFSVYAIVYTVDFHWEIDGKTYDFSIPGGGFVSLSQLVEALGIANQDAGEGDQTEDLLADVEKVEFSRPELMSVSKAETSTTVGAIKDSFGLECEYSAEMTSEQIAQINAQTVDAGDWALISLKPFLSTESLVVTLKTGETFTIKLTDAQVKKTVISASGDSFEITVTYDDTAQIPDGAELRVREITEQDEGYANLQEDIASNLKAGAEKIPAHPVLFDISIVLGGEEIEPAAGSEVKVEVKLVKSAMKGMFTEEGAPLLVNDEPVTEEAGEFSRALQVIHQVEEGQLEVMETTGSEDDGRFVSEFMTGSFSNWLIYLDEDLGEIEIKEGDTITLREFTEWIWHKDEEAPEYEGAQWRMFHDNQFWEPTDAHVSNGVISFQKYTRAVSEDEIHEAYDIFHGTAVGQGEIHLYKVNSEGQAVGKRLTIRVTQNGSAAPATIPDSQIADVKVNIFDYNTNKDLDVNGNVASSWDYNNYRRGYIDYHGNRYDNPPYEKSVNTSSNLKFLGWGASNSSQSKYGLNSYTANAPLQGIVKDELTNNVPVLSSTYSNTAGGDSLGYLFDVNANSEAVKAYPNVSGLFQQDSKGYYYYNSNQNYAYYNGQKMVLYEHTYTQVTAKNGQNQPSSKPIGFFPFHEYNDAADLSPNHDQDLNHHFGMSMNVSFALPEDKLNQGEHIIYEFSGDDDLWVFVDGKLALDIGGIHQPLRGYIDFTDGKVYVYGVNGNVAQEVDWIKNLATGVEHTLDMFYVERGGCDSNLSVKYNIPLILGKADVTVVKQGVKAKPDDEDVLLPGAKFGVWDNENCSESPLRTAVSNANGVVSFEGLPVLEEGQVYYMREIEAPEGYFRNSKIYKLTARKTGSNPNTYVYDISVKDDPSEVIEMTEAIPQLPIVYNEEAKDVDLTVEKRWQNLSGEPVVPGNSASATFQVKRYKSEDGVETVSEVIQTDETDITLRIHVWGHEDDWNQGTGGWYDGHPVERVTEYDFVRGSAATINWSYQSNYSANAGLHRRIKVGKNAAWQTLQYDGRQNGNLPSSGQINVTVPDEGVLDIYFIDEWLAWNDDNLRSSISASGTTGAKKKETINHVIPYTNWVPDNGYTGPSLTLPTDADDPDDPWKGVFDGLPAYEYVDSDNDGTPDKNIYYRYYVVETARTPADSTIVYIDGEDQVVPSSTGGTIPDPSALLVDHSDTQVVINKIATGSLAVTKTVQTNGQSDASAAGTYWFGVYEGEYNASTNARPVRQGFIEIGTGDSGTKTVPVENLPYGTYYVYELTGQNGTPIISGSNGVRQVLDDAVYIVTGSGTQRVVNGGASSAVELINNMQTTEITIHKVDESNVNDASASCLKGAGFKITKFEDNTFRQIDESWGTGGSKSLVDENNNGTYSLNGSFHFDGLPAGYYMLEETQYPEGYIKIDVNPTFQIKPTADLTAFEVVQLVKGEGDEYIPGTTDMVHVFDSTAIINVGNEPGVALPDAGGPGAVPIYLLGTALIGLAGAILVTRRRRSSVA